MTTHHIKKGFDIRLSGAPSTRMDQAPEPLLVGVCPSEFPDLKAKLVVQEGDEVKTGDVLFFDKKERELKKMSVLKLIKDGELYVPIDTLMEGIQRSTRTKLHVDEYKTNLPDSELPLDMFTEAHVKSSG